MESGNVNNSCTFCIVGGGIAGVSCAEQISFCCPNEPIILITESALIKTITNLEPLTKCLYKFNVEESEASSAIKSPSIRTIVDTLCSIDTGSKRIYTTCNLVISYCFLCLCNGGRPKLIRPDHARVIGIRDTDSVLKLQQRTKSSRRLVLVGNGGIASELAYEIKNIEIHWVIKDNYIASTFIDPGAAHFFEQSRELNEKPQATVFKRMRFTETLPNKDGEHSKAGAALGPDWLKNFTLTSTRAAPTVLKMYYNAEISSIKDNADTEEGFGLTVNLTTGESIECDFLISATGVCPRLDFSCDQEIMLSSDGFILVNALMESNVKNIYAAGDICSANWTCSENWFQMRLWTQARQMGAMAGRSMAAAFKKENISQDFCFELFGHVTQLFGFDVVLLGCFNGQGLADDYEILIRSTPGKEYIKLVICKGRMRGAILIGNMELTETCENLILNGLDISAFGDDILNSDIDIEDFFD